MISLLTSLILAIVVPAGVSADPFGPTPEQLKILKKYKDAGITRPMKFLAIPFNRGKFAEFTMGCNPEADSDVCMISEREHRVRLTEKFEMQETEVTQAQWLEIMGSSPSKFSERKNCPGNFIEKLKICPNHPVELVGWFEIANLNHPNSFLSKINSIKNDGYTYRLPTEAEWEYAARANTTTKYLCGDEVACMRNYAIMPGNNPGSMSEEFGEFDQPADVASIFPNPFGLYDIFGNVDEIVQDPEGKYEIPTVPTDYILNPEGLSGDTNYRISRGGSWLHSDIRRAFRSAYRGLRGPEYVEKYAGFRLVRVKKKFSQAVGG